MHYWQLGWESSEETRDKPFFKCFRSYLRRLTGKGQGHDDDDKPRENEDQDHHAAKTRTMSMSDMMAFVLRKVNSLQPHFNSKKNKGESCISFIYFLESTVYTRFESFEPCIVNYLVITPTRPTVVQ